MKRIFVESTVFQARVRKLGDLELLVTIQKSILENPEIGEIVVGSGGVRKFRVGREGAGKSGGYRVYYFDLPDRNMTHLLAVYAKNEKENISISERNGMKVEAKRLKGRR